MRILFIQPTSDRKGHYSLWTVKMCQALSKTGHDLVLFTNKVYPERYLKEKPLFKVVEADNGKYSFEKFQQNSFPLYYWWGHFKNGYIIFKSALEYCKKEKFDVIFLTDVEFLTATLLLKIFFNPIPALVWYIHMTNFTYDTYSGSFIKKSYKVIQREIFRKVIGREAKAFAVLSDWHREKLRQQLRINEKFPIEVIPDCGEVLDNQLDRSSARQMIGINYDGTLFMFLGMLRKDKGIEYLIEAASYLKSKELKFLIAGSLMHYTESQIKDLINKFGVSEKVILRLSYIPDNEVPLYYSSCDAVIFPYPKIYTGGTGPLLKGACTYGKPVIATDISEMGRAVREYKLGLLAEAENSKSLAQQMEKFLLLSENEKNELAKNAIFLAKKNSWDAVAHKLVGFLGKIASIENAFSK